MIRVLAHESIHCAIANVTDDADLMEVQRGFDRLYPMEADMERLMR